MFKRILVLLVVLACLDGYNAKPKEDLVDLFRNLYRIDKQKHEQIRETLSLSANDKVARWNFLNEHPELRVQMGVDRYFHAIKESFIRTRFSGPAAVNNELLRDIADTEVMRRTFYYLHHNYRIADVDLKTIWTKVINNQHHAFERIFLAEEKFDVMTYTRTHISHDSKAMHNQMNFVRDVVKEIPVAPDVEIVKMAKDSSRNPQNFLFGLSVELEMAIYTTCFILHPNAECEVALENKKFKVFTSGMPERYIVNAYPML